jgi:hypothetical protein
MKPWWLEKKIFLLGEFTTSTLPLMTILTPQQILIHKRKKITQERIIFCLNFLSMKIQIGKVKEIIIKEIAKIT